LAEIFTGKMVVGCILILISVIFTELMPLKPVAAVVEAPSSPLP